MTDEIPLFRIDWGRDEVTNAVDSITRGSHWAKGPYIDEFEERLEEFLGIDNAVVFNSGTTALVSALQAHGIGTGDEVIVPSFTFVATANAVKLAGAEPVFADIEDERYGLSPDSVSEKITDDTEAILPVHYAGVPCYISEIREIADENGLVLIEDAAEAFGAEHGSEMVGTFGDSAMLSFCQNKVVTTGEGGALITNDGGLAEKFRLLRSHGRTGNDYFETSKGAEYVSLGNNFRMPDLVASVGVAQISRAEEIISKRREVAAEMTERLSGIGGISTPSDPTNGRHVYQLYTVTFDHGIDRDQVIETLSEDGISSKVYFDPVHLTKFYRKEYGYTRGVLEVTEDVSSRVLSLPMHPNLSDESVERIVECLRNAVENQRAT